MPQPQLVTGFQDAPDPARAIDVIVVGAGPTGASAAVMLARHGLRVTLISRGTWVADSPRAHITNQRTMEVLRSIGLEDTCRAVAVERKFMESQVLCTSIAGQEIGRVWSWGNDPKGQGEYLAASPTEGCDLPQDRLEPILLAEAARLGVRMRFETEFVSLEQDDAGVAVTLRDLQNDEVFTLDAQYVIGADGGRSPIAEAIGLPFEGTPGMGNAMNVRFTADLSKHVAHRPGSLYYVLQPDRVDGLGHAVMRMVRPWHDWVVSFVHLGARNATLTPEEAQREVELLINDDSVDVEVTGFYRWRINHVYASHYSVGRVFCAGDSVHRHPPMNGLGANTCIQDSFNLAWKIAYVVRGIAGPGLLDSYSLERQPVGKQIVDRAVTSWFEERGLLEALGLDPEAPVDERQASFAELSAPTEAGEKRRAAVAEANEKKAYVYHASGVEMNQMYGDGSRAIVADGEAAHVFERDPELIIQPTSRPGARLPHAWVSPHGETVSTLDLVSPESFTLLVRERGAAWVSAAQALSREMGVPLRTHMIGHGGDVLDPFGDFGRLSEIGEGGCLLVRPDQHVAWRQRESASDHARVLGDVLRRLLDRE